MSNTTNGVSSAVVPAVACRKKGSDSMSIFGCIDLMLKTSEYLSVQEITRVFRTNQELSHHYLGTYIRRVYTPKQFPEFWTSVAARFFDWSRDQLHYSKNPQAFIKNLFSRHAVFNLEIFQSLGGKERLLCTPVVRSRKEFASDEPSKKLARCGLYIARWLEKSDTFDLDKINSPNKNKIVELLQTLQGSSFVRLEDVELNHGENSRKFSRILLRIEKTMHTRRGNNPVRESGEMLLEFDAIGYDSPTWDTPTRTYEETPQIIQWVKALVNNVEVEIYPTGQESLNKSENETVGCTYRLAVSKPAKATSAPAIATK